MKFGPHSQAIVKAALDAGHPVPEEVIPPEILPECEFALEAFHELKTDRQGGFIYGPIPWTAIDAYARRYGITDTEEFDDFVLMIRAMDDVYLKAAEKRDK